MLKWVDASAYWGRRSMRTPGVDDVGTFVQKMDDLNIEIAAITGLRALVDNTRQGNREVAALLRQQMSGAYELAVPLRVDVKVGQNWYEMTDL